MRLTYAALRAANIERLPLFKNARGDPAHSQPDGSDWSLTDWATAVAGEVGEACNLIKKVRRGDMTLDQARAEIAKELADVAIYLDILAYRAGIDLGGAVMAKWNETSVKIGVDLRLGLDGVYRVNQSAPTITSSEPVSTPGMPIMVVPEPVSKPTAMCGIPVQPEHGKGFNVLMLPRFDGLYYPCAVPPGYQLTATDKKANAKLVMAPADVSLRDPAAVIEWAYANAREIAEAAKIPVVTDRS